MSDKMVGSSILSKEMRSKDLRIRKSSGELAILCILGLLGIYVAVWAQFKLPTGGGTFGGTSGGVSIGPRFFPQVSGIVMTVASLYLVSKQIWDRQRGTIDDEIVETTVGALLRVALYFLMIVAYLLLFIKIGFLISTMGMLFVSIALLGQARSPADFGFAFVIALLFTIVVYVLFVVVLKLPVPDPILGGLL